MKNRKIEFLYFDLSSPTRPFTHSNLLMKIENLTKNFKLLLHTCGLLLVIGLKYYSCSITEDQFEKEINMRAPFFFLIHTDFELLFYFLFSIISILFEKSNLSKSFVFYIYEWVVTIKFLAMLCVNIYKCTNVLHFVSFF